MRSTVIETHRPPNVARQDPRYGTPYTSQKPPVYKQRPGAQYKPKPPVKQRHFRLAPLEGWSSLCLLAIALYSVVASIIAAKWVSHGTLLLASPVVGLVLGLVIAKIPRFPQAILHLAACLVGYWFAIWLTCALSFHIPWSVLLGGLRTALTGGMTTSVMPASDLVFFFYLAFLCFFLGYFGCWLVYRAHLPWLVALVYSAIMLVNLNYVQENFQSLIVVLAASLILLVARVQLVAQLLQWTREGLYTDRSWRQAMTLRCMQVTTVMAVIVLLASWLLPGLAQPAQGKAVWDSIDNAVTNVANGHVSWQDPGSLIQPYQTPSNYFGDQLTVSGRVQLPAGQVLSYTSSAGPRYLEGSSYNLFDGHTWSSSLTTNDAHNYSPNEPLPPDSGGSGFETVKVRVTVVQPTGGTKPYLFGPPQPVLFDVPSTVYDDSTAGAWVQQGAIHKSETYQVTSLAPPNDAQLFSGIPLPSENVDAWRQDSNYNQLSLYYTQVPNKLSPLVQQTTTNWTKNARDTYSALKLLEAHLNNPAEFTYSLDNPPIPANVDVATWLLQTKRGYCTYYASTMIVMARLLGIPTRMVTGFSQGTFDRQHNAWSVMGGDAHSWVQAYLPSIGWVNFDPTPGYAPGALPAQKTPATTTAQPTTHPKPTVTPPAKRPTPAPQQNQPIANQHTSVPTKSLLDSSLFRALLAVIGMLLLVLLAVTFAMRWWNNLYAQHSRVASMFWRLCHLARLVGFAPKTWQTPYEYGQMLSRHFPQHSLSLWRLTDLFVRERWGSPYQAPRAEEEQSVAHLWPSLQRMFLARSTKR